MGIVPVKETCRAGIGMAEIGGFELYYSGHNSESSVCMIRYNHEL